MFDMYLYKMPIIPTTVIDVNEYGSTWGDRRHWQGSFSVILFTKIQN